MEQLQRRKSLSSIFNQEFLLFEIFEKAKQESHIVAAPPNYAMCIFSKNLCLIVPGRLESSPPTSISDLPKFI